ncbi:unnamed protein product, partial [Meganyctiphanes norvegica]
DEPYEALSKNLPPLLMWPHEEGTRAGRSSISNSGQSIESYMNANEYMDSVNSSDKEPIVLDETRLQVLNGRVPYLPCKIKEYSAYDIGTCVLSRAAAGSSTWVAFVGASKMRMKLHQFIRLLPNDFTYTYFVRQKQVNKEKFLYSLNNKVKLDVDIIGFIDTQHFIKLTIIWDPYGTGNIDSSDISKPPFNRFFKWADDAIIPDVVVLGLGTWYLVQPATIEHEDQLDPLDRLDINMRILQIYLQKLTTRTKVLLWAHSRYRQYNLFSQSRPRGDWSNVKIWFRYILYLHLVSYSIGYMDSWMANIILR